jgi:hypothetical protein
MAMRPRQYHIKGNPTIELLAITLFNDSGIYACSWADLAEQTRERYRKMAKGEIALSGRGELEEETEEEKIDRIEVEKIRAFSCIDPKGSGRHKTPK